MIHYVDVAVQYDRERIFRRLHIAPGTSVCEYAAEAFPALEDLVRRHLEMVHCYTVLEHRDRTGISEVDRGKYVVVCLSSCAQGIVEEITQLLDRGDYLEGYILNDMVNEIFFNASDQMNRVIAAHLRGIGCNLTRRFSPGEGEFALEYQTDLLECFRGESALRDIHLTESYMLYPEKSMLYLFGADPGNPALSVEHDCRICPNLTCFFREETAGASACS